MKTLSDNVLLSRLILTMFHEKEYTIGTHPFHYIFDAWIFGRYVVSSVEILSLMDARKEGLLKGETDE